MTQDRARSRTLLFGAALLAGSTVLAACAAEAPGIGRPEVSVERFERLDRTRWFVADGWTNGDYQNSVWLASQVRVDDDGLALVYEPVDHPIRDHATGEVQERAIYQYGYFEARMQAARGSGLINGFFLYDRNDETGERAEIDVEILGRDTRSVQFTHFIDRSSKPTTVPLPFDAAEGEHIYAFEWEPDAIRWYVDGELMHEERGVELRIPEMPQGIYAHLWGTDTLVDWAGAFEDSDEPRAMRISCFATAPEYPGEPLCADG